MRTRSGRPRYRSRHPEGGRHRSARPDEGGVARARGASSICAPYPTRARSSRSRTEPCASARWSRWRSSPSTSLIRTRYRAVGRGRGTVGQPADPAGGHDRRQPAAAAALLVFPLAASSLRAQRAAKRASRLPARTNITRSSARTAAPSCIRRPPRRLWSHSMPGSSWRARTAEARRGAGGFLPDARAGHRARERSEAGRDPDCRAAAAARSAVRRSAHLRQGELDSFDWPLADVAVVLDIGAGGICRARLGRARRRGARSASGQSGGEGPRREARSTTMPRAARRAPRSQARRRSAGTPTSCRSSRRW